MPNNSVTKEHIEGQGLPTDFKFHVHLSEEVGLLEDLPVGIKDGQQNYA